MTFWPLISSQKLRLFCLHFFPLLETIFPITVSLLISKQSEKKPRAWKSSCTYRINKAWLKQYQSKRRENQRSMEFLCLDCCKTFLTALIQRKRYNSHLEQYQSLESGRDCERNCQVSVLIKSFIFFLGFIKNKLFYPSTICHKLNNEKRLKHLIFDAFSPP